MKPLGRLLKSFKAFFLFISLLFMILQPARWAVAEGKTSPKSNNVFVSLHPGSYNSNQVLKLEPLGKNIALYYSLNISGTDRDRVATGKPSEIMVPYLEPLKLTAIEGEARTYTLHVYIEEKGSLLKAGTYRYIIDKVKPPLPEVNVHEGVYRDRVEVSFTASGNEKIFYSVNENIFEKATLWDKKPFELDAERGKQRTFTLYYFAEDESGNRSAMGVRKFTVVHGIPHLDVISPSDGEYGNYQYLYINNKHIKWIKYTLDGSDPLKRGIPYNGPTLLKRTGRIVLNIVAAPYRKNEPILRKKVEFFVEGESIPSVSLDTESGIYHNGLKVIVSHERNSKVFYTLSERTPKSFDLIYTNGISLPSIPGFSKFYVLRLRAMKSNGEWGREYRYFYLIDRHRPARPAIHIERMKGSKGTSNETFKISIETVSETIDSKNTVIYYTLDDSKPDTGSKRYSKPFTINPRSLYGKEKGIIVVKAITVSLSGVSSEVSRVELPFNLKRPHQPKISIQKIDGHSYLLSGSADSGAKIIYEMTNNGSSPKDPNANSAVLEGKKLLDLPYGAYGDFRFVFSSMDSYGNLSAENVKQRIVVDRLPPGEPSLTPRPGAVSYDSDITVKIKSDGKVFYEITSNGALPEDPGSGSNEYKNGILLKGRKNNIVHYQIKLISKDKNGNFSRVYGPYHYFIDLTVPVVPEIKAVRDNLFYNKKIVEISFPPGSPKMHYTFATGKDEPPDPTLKDPIVKGKLRFKGKENGNITYIVKLLPVSTSEKIVGPIRKFSFTIDLQPPEVPGVRGFKSGGIYRHPVTLYLLKKKPEDDSTVYISYSTSDAPPPDPVLYGKKYGNPMVFDVNDNEEKSFKLRMTALDRAGNRALYDRFYTFTIDRKAPEEISVRGIPESGITNKTVVVEFHTNEGEIYYNITDDGSEPEYPTKKSREYDSPIILTGEKNREITYKIFPRIVDRVGNFSKKKNVYVVTIDKLPPEPPQKPELISLDNKSNESLLVIFKKRENEKIYFTVSNEGGERIIAKQEYRGPFTISTNGQITYYAEDIAGNKSKESRISIHLLKKKPNAPIITGVSDGGVYNHPVSISFRVPDLNLRGTIRYEMTTDGSEPPDVTEDSPVATSSVGIDAQDGETLRIVLKAKYFEEGGGESKESRVEFLLDRTPPPAPIAIGIQDNMRYEDSKIVRLVSSEGKIYYAVSSDGKIPPIPRPTDKNAFKQEILLKAENGEIKDYRIVAYTMDKAGNRSRDIPIWRVLIDRKVVYVSPEGNNLYDGTASKPLLSIEKALELARKLGRKTIYLARGNYQLNKPIHLTIDGLNLVGGLSPSSWKKELFGFSKITTGRYFKRKNTLLTVEGKNILLENIIVTSQEDSCDYLIEQKAGSLELKNSTLILNTTGKETGILQTGGELLVKDSVFTISNTGNAQRAGKVLTSVMSTGGILNITSSDFESSGKAEKYTAIDIRSNRGANLNSVKIEASEANENIGIKVQNSNVKINGGSIHAGNGIISSVGLTLADSILSIRKTRIFTDRNARYSTGIYAKDSKLSIEEGILQLDSRLGATGIRTKAGTLYLSKSRIIGRKTQEFLYLLNIEGQAEIYNNIMLGGNSGDVISVQASGGEIKLINNTMVGGKGENVTNGIMITGAGNISIINNIIARYGNRRGTAIFLSKAKNGLVTIKANDIYGWKNILLEEEFSASGRAFPNQQIIKRVVIDNVESLNLLDNNPFGGKFEKNISENIEKTFVVSKEIDFHLSRDSLCVNGGINIGPSDDIDGESRPAPDIGIRPIYDIGADEVY